jgi:hypothetical protein
MLVSYLAYFSTLNMEAGCSFLMVEFKWTAQPYVPDDRILHHYHCENLKSCSCNLLGDDFSRQRLMTPFYSYVHLHGLREWSGWQVSTMKASCRRS